MMSETVVTVQDAPTNNANPRQTPTVKTDPGQPGLFHGIALNLPYFRTIPGIIKLVQLALGIICMACASPAYVGATHWFLFVAVIVFISTLTWIFIYFLSIREALKLPVNWIITELLNTGVETVLYTTAFIAQLSVATSFHVGPFRNANISAGVFGIFNTIAYAAGTYFLYLEWKNSNTQ